MINASLVKELRDISGAGMMDCKKALEATEGNVEAAIDWLREKGFAKASKKESRIAAEGLAKIFTEGNKTVMVELNSETDFVSKNDEFKNLLDEIGNTILKNNVHTIEEVLSLSTQSGTINDLIIAKTAKIGEKLSLRRFQVIEKNDNQVFGCYTHNGGKIIAVVLANGSDENIVKDIAMQVSAMRPQYVNESEVPAEVIEKEKEILKAEAMNEGKPEDIALKMVEGRLKKHFKDIVLEMQSFIKDGDIDVATYAKNNNCEILNMYRYEVGEGMEKRNDDFAQEVMSQVKGE